jgi:hypothetical protein
MSLQYYSIQQQRFLYQVGENEDFHKIHVHHISLSDIEVTVDISMKKEMSHPYRTVINKHKVRWCGLYDKTKRQDFFTNLGLKVFQESVSQVFEKCPISKVK